MTAKRILIAGGGIAGLNLDLALRGGPWDVELAERGTLDGGPGAGLVVQPNAMRVLRELGVADAVAKSGTVVRRFQYRDQSGTLLCDIDLCDLWGDVGPFIGITRTGLHAALRADAAPHRTGMPVTSVRQDDGGVSARFGDGTTAVYDLVVGADGINSDVRRSAVGPSAPAYSGQMGWRSVARMPDAALDAIQLWLGSDRVFGLCPAGDGIIYGFGYISCPRMRDPADGRKRRLAGLFADFGAPIRDFIAAVETDTAIHCAPVEWLPGVAWGNGQVILIGDAAHAMSPMMGQGGCMAIEDGFVLADELRRSADIPDALAAFARRRGSRVDWVRGQSQALGDLVRLPAVVRDAALAEHGAATFADRFRPLITAP
jgi:2-polyprenyl-6-methoxyphenol hydroxylase-like FAD-dependent oxidoreductase